MEIFIVIFWASLGLLIVSAIMATIYIIKKLIEKDIQEKMDKDNTELEIITGIEIIKISIKRKTGTNKGEFQCIKYIRLFQ